MSNTLGFYLATEYTFSRKKNEYFHFFKRLFWTTPRNSCFRKTTHTDSCAICCSPMVVFSHLWITQCGHVFHKQCLYQYMKTQLLSPDYTRCPLCRRCMGNLEFLDGWMYQVGMEKQCFSDLLEEIHHLLPKVCQEEETHYLGMQKDCDTCQLWRQGKIRQ